MQECAVM